MNTKPLPFLAAALAIHTAPVAAQPAPPPTQGAVQGAAQNVIAYPASFFAAARATNALEMLQRVPGFTLDGGADDARGLAGAGGNVLIDGKRPSSKAVSLEDLLRRIPPANVERIELIRGGAPGIDMQGYPQVANVVRSRQAATTQVVVAGARLFADGWVGPQADYEWSRRQGDLSLEGAVRAGGEMDEESGAGRLVRRDASGGGLSELPLFQRERGRRLQANGAAELTRPADTFRLNLGAEEQTERTVQRAGAGPDLDEQVAELRKGLDLELGGDWQHAFTPATFSRLILLATRSEGSSLERSGAGADEETADSDSLATELVLRGSVTSRRSDTLTFETGGEIARNRLVSSVVLTEGGAPSPIPNADITVEEQRGEAFVTAFWRPTPRLSAEAGVRAERSTISQSGDSAQERSFQFAKPRLILAFAQTPDRQLRLRLEREVGQLDFEDFAAQAELAGGGTVNAGNAALEPERSWVAEAAFEQRFLGKGALVVAYTHAEVEQVIDRVPVENEFDAPGNIGDGRRDEVRLTLTAPFDRLGLANGLLTAETAWRWSSVVDPVTGQSRRISGEAPFDGTIRFTQDLARPRSTWGVEATYAGAQRQYRLDEVRRERFGTYWSVFFDWKPRPDLSVRAELQNPTERVYERDRVRYAGPRSGGTIRQVEQRRVDYGRFVYLRVRKQF